MPSSPVETGNLVVYKQQPARVHAVEGDKLTLQLPDGGTKRVRPKDVLVLHPGPVADIRALDAGAGEMEEAWEALAGESLSLEDLAELAYGAFTPATAWSSWREVADGLLFEGEPDALVARERETVAAERERRETKAQAAAARKALLERLVAGAMAPGDEEDLAEVERLALGASRTSFILRELGREETPEEAHRLLLANGYWDELTNPHPVREGAPQASAEGEVPPLTEEARRDLTHLEAWAIDDAGNTDPDDALSLDGDRIWVHIADVAAVAPPDAPLDLEARERGATLYLPDGMRTMLPPPAVERLGLGLADTSPALSVGFRVAEDGGLTDIEVAPSWVRAARLSYQAAEERMAEEPFASLAEAAERFRQRRRADGAVEFQLPEVSVRLEDGEVVIRPIVELASRRLVTEAMIMAGHAVARFAQQEGLAIPFATQEAPQGKAEGEGLLRAYELRKLMRPSRVQLTPEPHSGLGLSAYAQATSPMRRYFDLVTHQQLRAHVGGGQPADQEALAQRVAGVGERVRRLRRAERLSNQHFKLVHLQRYGAWQGQGVVVERNGPKGRVLVPELALETSVTLPKTTEPGAVVTLQLLGVELPTLEPRFRAEEDEVAGLRSDLQAGA
ncbi:RNB domain-containing ribonuclease [Thiohalorhabdus sp. Cl-TMA]|uniref:RNB domain-containing ribonuclease n=1 Tax=Thiohalorhabdus methylotrophus TaxID=3242694 RepID=A0ABV4TQK9_9GAMM